MCVMESVTAKNGICKKKKMFDTEKDLESQSLVRSHSFPAAHFAPSLRLAIIACGVGNSTWLSQATNSFIHLTSSATVKSVHTTRN